mmetsp:Transcript_22759/g.50596  ORF Transcript_22759/g.50596 Transcript_22759/m.50596 type:complete len:242 (-) Transcript_22759:200-925(-)
MEQRRAHRIRRALDLCQLQYNGTMRTTGSATRLGLLIHQRRVCRTSRRNLVQQTGQRTCTVQRHTGMAQGARIRPDLNHPCRVIVGQLITDLSLEKFQRGCVEMEDRRLGVILNMRVCLVNNPRQETPIGLKCIRYQFGYGAKHRMGLSCPRLTIRKQHDIRAFKRQKRLHQWRQYDAVDVVLRDLRTEHTCWKCVPCRVVTVGEGNGVVRPSIEPFFYRIAVGVATGLDFGSETHIYVWR